MDSAGEGLTAGLAKGLRVCDGAASLCEEGMGFGVPVIVSRFRTYLSYSARETGSGKVFLMDAIQTVREKKVPGVLPYFWLEAKGRIYKSFPSAQRFMLWKRATGNLTPQIGFAPCEPQCEIPVTYETDIEGVRVTVDLTGAAGLSGSPKIFMLNEQGGRAFPVFLEEGCGSESVGWKKVTAGEAGFLSADRHRGFSLHQIAGVPMYRGREVVGDTLSWSGIEYDVTSRIGTTFTYHVRVHSDDDSISLRH